MTLAEHLGALLGVPRAHVCAEPDRVLAHAVLDDLVETREGAAADEQDVRRVDGEELLVRMLAAALGRHRGDRSLEDLEQRLLDSFARDVARDRRVVRLPRDLVDLVDVDDPGLGLLDVEVGGLDQLQQDVLDVLAHVARLRERGGVGDRERHVEDAGERLRKQRLTAAGRARAGGCCDFWSSTSVVFEAHANALVVVVDRDRERPLRLLLGDDVVVEDGVDVDGFGRLSRSSCAGPVSSSSMISLQRSMHSSQM